jgi:S-DNA-T family DNA segregation ATPase FtsK/SpoIIIE
MGPEVGSSTAAVIERWVQSHSIVAGKHAVTRRPEKALGLRSVVGSSAAGRHVLDLRVHGPHALVGGTTGAGKSELLQTWILGLASAHSPQRVNFLLVDYKGGTAFSDCVDLPHTVGMVTDLSPHEVRRALTSLKAEIHHREVLLNEYRAKDLATLELDAPGSAPPSLVIVVDEFAALAKEVPEFVEGVVDVAQRGRSLGLHLILATQRPAGVITDNIRANTNLRVALRMADEDNSTDVLGSPVAAGFDPALAGRAVSKTGPGRLVPFQTAYAGGWTLDETPPEILLEELTFGIGREWRPPVDDNRPAPDPKQTDIKRMVRTIRKASVEAELPAPRIPWKPVLGTTYDLSKRAQVPTDRRDNELVFGIGDLPERQEQPTVAFYPDRHGNLAVFGTGGSGKSTLLRTIAVAASHSIHGGPCHVYGLDFGSRGLALLEPLPNVGTIVYGDDHERLVRLLTWLRELVVERARRYSAADAGTIAEYRERANTPEEPRILLLVDGLPAFRSAYESSDRSRLFDLFASIATDGRAVGVHIVASSDQRGAVSTNLSSAFQARVVLRMVNQEDYAFLNVPVDILQPASPPGRGIFDGIEVQVAVLAGRTDVLGQAAALRAFATMMEQRMTWPAAPQIAALTEQVDLITLPVTVDDLPTIGIASSTLAPFGIYPHGTFVVSGPPKSGRTTTLLTLVRSLRSARPGGRMYYIGNRRSPLAGEPGWLSIATSAEEATLLAQRVLTDLANATDSTQLVVVIENASDYQSSSAENELQDMVRALIAHDQFLVVEGEATTLQRDYGSFLQLAKGSRTGLALRPDQGDGTPIFRTDFPRIDRSAFPPGRALYVTEGSTEVVQVAYTNGADGLGGVGR